MTTKQFTVRIQTWFYIGNIAILTSIYVQYLIYMHTHTHTHIYEHTHIYTFCSVITLELQLCRYLQDSYLHGKWVGRNKKHQKCLFLPAHLGYNKLISVYVEGGQQWWRGLKLFGSGYVDVTVVFFIAWKNKQTMKKSANWLNDRNDHVILLSQQQLFASICTGSTLTQS